MRKFYKKIIDYSQSVNKILLHRKEDGWPGSSVKYNFRVSALHAANNTILTEYLFSHEPGVLTSWRALAKR